MRAWHGVRRQWWLGIVAIVALGAALAGCAGAPAQLNTAAVVDGHIITLDDYLKLSRLLFAIDGLQSSPATWQLPAGRQELASVQQRTLNVLISNALFLEQADTFAKDKNHKNAPTVSSLQATIASQTKAQYAQLVPQYPQLVEQGILTEDSYRLLEVQQIVGNAVLDQITVPVAHVRILTVPTQSQALDLQQQLQKGAKWVDLVQKNSTDAAHDQGGEIPQLPGNVLTPELDRAIFQTKTDPTAIQIVHSALGYTLLQVQSVDSKGLKDLDNTVPVVTNARSIQSAAIDSYLISLFHNAKINIDVDWCADPSGTPCPTLSGSTR